MRESFKKSRLFAFESTTQFYLNKFKSSTLDNQHQQQEEEVVEQRVVVDQLILPLRSTFTCSSAFCKETN